MSLYRLDDSVRQLLRLDNFGSSGFSTKSFLEQLSSSQSHAAGNEVLDPKPFIRTFEAAASELERLSEVAQHQEESSGAAANQLRESHNLNVIDMAANVEQCVSDIHELDEQVSELSRATAYMGDKLERFSRMHRQVVTLRHLIDYYLSFVKRGSSSELLKLFQSQSSSDRRRCAQAVGQLQLLARKIGTLPNNRNVEEDIDKFAEHMETHFIQTFQDAYTSFDLTGMREIAQILYEFNGSVAVVQAFVNQHDFFMQVDKVDDESALQNETLWAHLTSLESEYPEFEVEVQNLVDEVIETIIQETKVIRKIFPKPVQVLTVFMQRIFAQRIQGQIMIYIEEAESRSPLAHVRVLYTCYHRIQLMGKTLKDFWTRSGVDKDGELSLMLDSNINDIFVMFLDKYLSAEIKNLQQIISETLTTIHDPKEAMGVRNRGSDHIRRSDSYSPAPEELNNAYNEELDESTRMDKFMRAVRLERTLTSASSRRRPAARSEAHLELAAVQKVLSAFAESVGREQVLSPPGRAEYDAIELFNLLLKEVGGKYINASLEDAVMLSQEQDVKTELDWSYLETVRRASNCAQLLNVFVRTVLLAMVRTSETTQQRMSSKIEQYLDSCQDTCNVILESASEKCQARTRFLLSRQKRRDYAPKEDVVIEQSVAGREVCSLLEQLGDEARKSLSGSNLQSFLLSVAGSLYNEIHNNIKKLTFNQVGGKILAIDLQEYEKLIVNGWKIQEVADSFATIRAIAKIYVVDASVLPSLLRDSHFARLKSHALREYISLRADHNQYDIQRLFLQKASFSRLQMF